MAWGVSSGERAVNQFPIAATLSDAQTQSLAASPMPLHVSHTWHGLGGGRISVQLSVSGNESGFESRPFTRGPLGTAVKRVGVRSIAEITFADGTKATHVHGQDPNKGTDMRCHGTDIRGNASLARYASLHAT